jgi:hypothetical protein
MINSVDEKTALKGLLRQAREFSTSEIPGDDWRGAINRWNALMSEMQKTTERLKQL